MSRGPTGVKGRPIRAGMGLDRSAWPIPVSVQPRFLSVKMMQPWIRGGAAIRREREPFAREANHKLERKERREIICEEDRSC
jgi:hypothetical protein